jgi:peptidyl-prolyl cis-trans isomerase C
MERPHPLPRAIAQHTSIKTNQLPITGFTNKRAGVVVVGLLLMVLFTVTIAGAENTIQVLNPVATVNDFIITPQDLDQETGLLRAEMDVRNQPISMQQTEPFRSQLIENLIDRELLYQQAQQKNIKIRSVWVDRAVAELKQRLKRVATMESYLEMSGLNTDQLRERIRKGLIVRRLLRREVLNRVKVSESEMQAFYQQNPHLFRREEQVRARHILIKTRGKESPEHALLQIQAIQAKLRQGADFAVSALEYSDCPSKNRGGDLGYFTRDQMVPSFSEAVFALAPGEISDIVTTRYGYHLIQLVDRRPPAQMAYKDVRKKIERTLRQLKEKKSAENYLAGLKRQAAIKRF